MPTRPPRSASSSGSGASGASAAERLIANVVSSEIEAAREERDQAVAAHDAMTAQLNELVTWLMESGYPFDWCSTEKPPEWLIPALAALYAARDGETAADYEDTIRDCVSETVRLRDAVSAAQKGADDG
jgi:hypothetical protein